MKVTATIVFVYGLLIVLGGIMGFVKGGSHASLISGGSFGIALLISAYFISKGKIAAQYLALVLTFMLDGIFTYRFAKTLHFIPAGFLSLASLAVLIVVALKIRRTRKLQ
ncbi:MAG: TMEM14 family protein [Verrucomicrobia bacterium]|nr:TMEM14 family protein [Verrucomicrobiota bacterium]